LQHGDGQQSQTEGEPPPQIRGSGSQQQQDAFDQRRLFWFESPAGSSAALLLARALGSRPLMRAGFPFLAAAFSYHLYKW
jgi:hypothetical protein